MSESSLASHSRTDWQGEEKRSRRPPQRGGRTLPPKGGSKQRGQQLDRRCFLSSGERLDPRRAEPDLTVIDCLAAQRHNIAAAIKRVWIVHRLSTRRQRSRASTPQLRTRIRPRPGTPAKEISLYIDRPFSAPKIHTRPRSLTRPLQLRLDEDDRRQRRSAAPRREAGLLRWGMGEVGLLRSRDQLTTHVADSKSENEADEYPPATDSQNHRSEPDIAAIANRMTPNSGRASWTTRLTARRRL